MSDSNAYINAYIELAVGMVHDQLNTILQMKAHQKITESVISQKDSVIADLTAQLTTKQSIDTEIHVLQEKLRTTEDSFHGLQNKVSHMETLQNQYNDLKNKHVQQSKELQSSIAEIAELKLKLKQGTERKDLKKSKKSVLVPESIIQQETQINNFTEQFISQRESSDF